MMLLTETSAPVTEEVVEVAEEAFNLSNHIHDNIWAYGALLVVALVTIGVIFLKKKSDREDKLAKRKVK